MRQDETAAASGDGVHPSAASADVREPHTEGAIEVGYRVALCLTGRRDAAAALLEESFATAWRTRAAAGPMGFTAWLLRVLMTRFTAGARAGEALARGGAAAASIPAAAAKPAGDGSDASAIAEVLHSLPLDVRAVTTLYCVQQMTCTDVAWIAGMPPENVRAALARGRQLLCAALGRLPEHHGVERRARLAVA